MKVHRQRGGYEIGSKEISIDEETHAENVQGKGEDVSPTPQNMKGSKRTKQKAQKVR